MKMYIAAPIFTEHQLAVVESIKVVAEADGWDVFSPFHASREIWKGRKPADCSPEERKAVLDGNVNNIDDCDLLVAWLQREDSGYAGRTDTGVAWEMGYATATAAALRGYWGDGSGTVLPRVVGYIHPFDPLPEKGVNLMLTGTMDGLVTSIYDLREVMRLMQQGHAHQISEKYPVNRLHERD